MMERNHVNVQNVTLLFSKTMSRMRLWYQRRKFVKNHLIEDHPLSSIFLKSPECDFDTKEDNLLEIHFTENHPLSSDHQRIPIQRIEGIIIGPVHINKANNLIPIQRHWIDTSCRNIHIEDSSKPGYKSGSICKIWKFVETCAVIAANDHESESESKTRQKCTSCGKEITNEIVDLEVSKRIIEKTQKMFMKEICISGFLDVATEFQVPIIWFQSKEYKESSAFWFISRKSVYLIR
jgi:hypothetical protein